MKDFNKVILMGHLGGEVTLRATKNGLPVASFSMATSRPKKVQPQAPESSQENSEQKSEETEQESQPESRKSYPPEETTWHRVVVWGNFAKPCASYLGKGSLVFVEGELRSRKWTGADGLERYTVEVHADSVKFLGARKEKVAAPALALA
jgi:single-strand DNA-binding protein